MILVYFLLIIAVIAGSIYGLSVLYLFLRKKGVDPVEEINKLSGPKV